jgi:uncharacterized protein
MTQRTEPTIPPVMPPPGVPAPQAGTVLAYHNEYVPTQDERTMALLIWLLGLLSGWIGPLIIWLVKREQSKFVDFHGKQSLFLHIVAVVLMVPMVVLMMLPLVGCVMLPLFLFAGIGLMVVQILLAVKANSGEWYRLPVVGEWV